MPSPARPDELDAIVALIASEQRRPERTIIYLGEEADGIRAELDDLDPDWRTTVRVTHGASGDLVAAALAEWDVQARRAWLHGPWVVGDDDAWARWARPLFDAVAAQVPADIVDREIGGTVANVRLAALAADLGWTPSETNHAFVLSAATVATWPSPAPGGDVRAATTADLEGITRLHDLEFPATYFSADQLLARAATGEQVVVVLEREGGSVVGYAAGRIQPDGEAYVDFLAVDEDARRTGSGRRLVVDMVRRLLPVATTGRVCLTVQEHRLPARALYEALGFRVDAAFRGYRTGRPD